jgi:hypothetical protein
MTLHEIGNDVRVAGRNCPKSGECERRGRCGNNHEEKPEGPEIAFSAPLDVIKSHGPWSYEQHSHQRNGASIHMEYSVNQLAGNLMQRKSLGNQLLTARRTVDLSERQVSIAVPALAGRLYRHE